MREKELAVELRRVANHVPVPPDLYPTGRLVALSRQPWWRRHPWVVAAAVSAGLILSLGLSPGGQRVVRAAMGLVTNYRVESYTLDPSSAATTNASEECTPEIYMTLEPGQVEEVSCRELPAGSYHRRMVTRVTTVAGLANVKPAWPLPTYLAPSPGDRVFLRQFYDLKSGSTVRSDALTMDYRVILHGHEFDISYTLNRPVGGIPEAMLESLQKGEQPGVMVGLPPNNPVQLQTEQVTFKGQRAISWGVGSTWHIQWWNTDAFGSISGTLPVSELIKVTESLPDLR